MSGRNPYDATPPTPEQLQRQIDATMRDVIARDARHDVHVHDHRTPDPTVPSGPEVVNTTGWQEASPMGLPGGNRVHDIIGAMCDAALGPVVIRGIEPAKPKAEPAEPAAMKPKEER